MMIATAMLKSGDRRRAEIAHDARRVLERVGADDQRVERDRERDPREAEEDARADRLAVGVEGDGEHAAEHDGATLPRIAGRSVQDLVQA